MRLRSYTLLYDSKPHFCNNFIIIEAQLIKSRLPRVNQYVARIPITFSERTFFAHPMEVVVFENLLQIFDGRNQMIFNLHFYWQKNRFTF